jgi:uncharacterized protein YndB with AHSA1/START domain
MHFTASPVQVWAMLSDPTTYPQWLIGAKEIRTVDDDWPEVGAAFHHTVGFGPLLVKDATSVLEQDPPRRLVLQARMGGALQRVVFDLAPGAHGGTDLTMQEYPGRGVLAAVAGPLLDLFTRARNELSLRRLRGLLQA